MQCAPLFSKYVGYLFINVHFISDFSLPDSKVSMRGNWCKWNDAHEVERDGFFYTIDFVALKENINTEWAFMVLKWIDVNNKENKAKPSWVINTVVLSSMYVL